MGLVFRFGVLPAFDRVVDAEIDCLKIKPFSDGLCHVPGQRSVLLWGQFYRQGYLNLSRDLAVFPFLLGFHHAPKFSTLWRGSVWRGDHLCVKKARFFAVVYGFAACLGKTSARIIGRFHDCRLPF